MVHKALDAANALADRGVSAEVVDLRTITPMDTDTVLASVAKTSRALVLYESHRFLGVGAEVAAVIAEEAFEHLDAPVMRLAPPNVPVPFSPSLEDAFLPSVEDIERGRRTAARPGSPPDGGVRMANVTMPQLGETVIEGTILKWLKSEGESVAQDEPLFEISTDKVDTEVPSPAAGTLTKILVPEGQTVAVGTELAKIDGAGEASAV